MNQSIQGTSKEMVDVGDLFKRSWALFTQKPIEHIVASLIVMVLGAVTLGVLFGPLSVGQIRMVEKQRRGEVPRIEDVFSGFASFGPALLAALIFVVAMAVGMFLFVLPGLFVIAAWSFAFWFIALRDSSAMDALAASWNLLKTQAGSVLVVLVLMAVVNAVASSVVLATLLSVPLSAIFCTLAFHDMTGSSASSGMPT
jgi:uncharacterized membrane protein